MAINHLVLGPTAFYFQFGQNLFIFLGKFYCVDTSFVRVFPCDTCLGHVSLGLVVSAFLLLLREKCPSLCCHLQTWPLPPHVRAAQVSFPPSPSTSAGFWWKTQAPAGSPDLMGPQGSDSSQHFWAGMKCLAQGVPYGFTSGCLKSSGDTAGNEELTASGANFGQWETGNDREWRHTAPSRPLMPGSVVGSCYAERSPVTEGPLFYSCIAFHV